MLGATRGVTSSLVGWLWADILLGLFVIFLAASAAPSSAATPASSGPSIDPVPVELMLPVDGPTLLLPPSAAAAAEQKRVASTFTAQMDAKVPGRRVAMILAYGTHADPLEGDRFVNLALAELDSKSSPYADATFKKLHELVANDRGTQIRFEVYLFR